MRRFVRNVSCLGVAVLLCLGVAVPLTAQTAAGAEDYYAPVTAAGGTELLGQLHDLVVNTHTRYCSYNDCRDYATTTDPALNGESGIVEFYTHETIAEYTKNGSDAGRWNREHVWPQSLSGGMWGKEGGGSDLHHIRPSEVKMNGTRGNDKFGEVPNGSPVYSKKTDGTNSTVGGTHAGGVFEPLDEAKGDVARIVLYVYTHYNTYTNVGGTTNGGGEDRLFGTLKLTQIVAAASEEEAAELLLEWNGLDPVDEIETTRNEAVYRIQGNRNPFIDHPEYADAVWGTRTQSFLAAVEAAEKAETFGERGASLRAAIAAYRALSAQERAAQSGAAEKLFAAIAAYNAEAAEYNEAAKRTDGFAVESAGGLT